MKQLKVMLSLLILSAASVCCMQVFAQTKTIHVTPDNAKIYVDGNEVGTGTYTVKFNRKTDFYVLKFEAPGYIKKTNIKLFRTNPNKTVSYTMYVDQFLLNSIGPGGGSAGEDAIDIANKWFEVTVSEKMTEDQVWKRLMSIANKNFENVEVRDRAAGWIRTAWAKTYFENQVARTRLEIKINTDNDEEISYKVKIYSEINDDIDCASDDCFAKSDRVLKKYVDVINELQNKLNLK